MSAKGGDSGLAPGTWDKAQNCLIPILVVTVILIGLLFVGCRFLF